MGAPSEEVAESPVTGTPISVIMDPKEEVAEIPVRVVVLSDLIELGDPKPHVLVPQSC